MISQETFIIITLIFIIRGVKMVKDSNFIFYSIASNLIKETEKQNKIIPKFLNSFESIS